MAFVADNSVIVAWFIGTQATPYTRRVAQRTKREQVTVPPVWPFEFVNVLRVHRRRGILAAHQVSRFIRQAQRLVVVDGDATSGGHQTTSVAGILEELARQEPPQAPSLII
jgi:predicted nucleic acid-binding protein